MVDSATFITKNMAQYPHYCVLQKFTQHESVTKICGLKNYIQLG